MENRELEILQGISDKLDHLIGLMAIQGKDRDSQLEALYGLGFDATTIGKLVGMQPSNVRTWKSQRTSARPRPRMKKPEQ